jgi:hypothetical protein
MEGNHKRSQYLYTIRTSVGWNAAKVASLLDVSPRTVGLWETDTQPMPDARWRLFMHEVANEIKRHSDLIVVFAADHVTPLDVVSDSNYVYHRIADDGANAVIASYVINRVSNKPTVHLQRFKVEGNEHVLRAAAHWDTSLRFGASTGEESTLALHRWLTRRVLEAEHRNPRLRELKDAIATASREVDLAADASGDVLNEKLRALDTAVFALIRESEAGKRVRAGTLPQNLPEVNSCQYANASRHGTK